MSVTDQTPAGGPAPEAPVPVETPSPTPPQTIIAIHGVGSPEPGQLVTDVADALALDHAIERRADPVEAGGQSHARLRLTGHPHVRDVIEVNWTDIEEPPRGVLSLMLSLFRILIALVQMAASGWRGARQGVLAPSFFASLFGYYMTFIGIWAIGLPLISLHMLAAQSEGGKAIALSAITLLTFVTTLVTARYDRRFRMGYVWTVINFAGGIFLISYPEYAALFTANAALMIDLLQVVGFGLPILAFFEMLVRMVILAPTAEDGGATRGDTILPFLVRFACMLLPLIVIAGLTALVFLMHILPYTFGSEASLLLELWLELFRYSGLDTQYLHRAAGWAIGTIGVFALVFILVPFLLSLRSRSETPPPSGRTFQTGMAVVLFLLPFLFLPLGITALVDMLKLGIPPIILDPLTVLMPEMTMSADEELYIRSGISAAILLAFMWLLLGPGRALIDVSGDVIFYVLPAEYEQNATAPALQIRVQALLDHLEETGDHGPLVLTGYSQGSVIAADAIKMRESGLRGRLVTVGSPIRSLYDRFLEVPTGFDGRRPQRWDNLYRPTDFVGGPIGQDRRSTTSPADKDTTVIGNRGRHHLDYWFEPEVRAALTQGGSAAA